MRRMIKPTAIAAVVIASAAMLSPTPTNATTERFLGVDDGNDYGSIEIVKDMETGVEYIHDFKHGGISPLYNCDGTMYTGW